MKSIIYEKANMQIHSLHIKATNTARVGIKLETEDIKKP